MNDVVRTVRIPEHDDKLIEQLVKQGRFINKSGFLRQAGRRKCWNLRGKRGSLNMTEVFITFAANPRHNQSHGASEDKERILRKTLEIIERPVVPQKTFTTKPLIRRKKTGHRLVRRTAQALIDYWYPETDVSYEAMDKILITRFGRCDKKTRLAYLGRPATRQVERVEQEVQYRKTGTITYKDHKFIHRLPAKKGYLELFGLATLYSDKNGKAWFRLHHGKQTTLIPPASPLQSINESVVQNYSKKFSLPLSRLPSYTTEQSKANMTYSETEKRESILTERENRLSESILTPEELRILRASRGEASQ